MARESGTPRGRAPVTAATWGVGASVLALGAVTLQAPEYGLLLGGLAFVAGLLTASPVLVGAGSGFSFFTTVKVIGFAAPNLVVAGLGLLGLMTVAWGGPRVRAALAGPILYLLLMAPGTALHPSADGLKALLLQRPVITAGAILAGAWLVRRGGTLRALFTSLYLASVVLAVVALRGFFTPGFAPLNLNKNYAGPLLVCVVMLRLVPHSLPAPQALRRTHLALLVLGIAGAGSRSAYLGLLVASLYYAFSTKGGSMFLRRVGVIVAVLIGAYLTYGLVQAQLSSDNRFNSAAVRPADAKALLNIFLNHPFLGLGMENVFGIKTDSAYGSVTAPALSLQTLAEGGLPGAFAFAALVFLPFRLKLGPNTAVVRALLIARVTTGQFDYFWSGGSTALVWLVIGIAACLKDRGDEVAHGPVTPEVAGRPPSRLVGTGHAGP